MKRKQQVCVWVCSVSQWTNDFITAWTLRREKKTKTARRRTNPPHLHLRFYLAVRLMISSSSGRDLLYTQRWKRWLSEPEPQMLPASQNLLRQKFLEWLWGVLCFFVSSAAVWTSEQRQGRASLSKTDSAFINKVDIFLSLKLFVFSTLRLLKPADPFFDS